MIYFLQLQENGPIKIGTTNANSVPARVKLIVSTMPYEATLLAVMEGGPEEERDLHDKFIDDNIRSEWFNPSKQILDYVAAIPPHPACDIFNGTDNRYTEFRFKMPKLMCSVIRDIAIDQGLSTSGMVRRLIKAGLEQQFPSKAPSRSKPTHSGER